MNEVFHVDSVWRGELTSYKSLLLDSDCALNASDMSLSFTHAEL